MSTIRACQEFETLHVVGIVGAATWFFFLLGMAMIIVGILALAPTQEGGIGSLCPCRCCKRVTLHVGTVVAHESSKRALHDHSSTSSLDALRTVDARCGSSDLEAIEMAESTEISEQFNADLEQFNATTVVGRRRSTSHARHKVGVGDEQAKPLRLTPV